MGPQPKVLFRGFVTLLFLLVGLYPAPLRAQDKPTVFWTHGGNWGKWLDITAHPGLAIRTACGDDTTLNNYPVSSTDWELRNNYDATMAVVWRVQFFDDSVGKNKMSGWMLDHLTSGEVLDGWNVEGGHCQARNYIAVQVKCAVVDDDEAKCYDPDGNPYPRRPDGAFSGAHKPVNSPSVTAAGKAGTTGAGHAISVLTGTGWDCEVDTSWRYPLFDLQDFRVTFLAKPDAIKAFDTQVAGVLIRHARWEIVGPTVTLRMDGSYPDPKYEGDSEAYLAKLSLDASTFSPSSYKSYDGDDVITSVTFDNVTKNAVSGWVAVIAAQRDKFLDTVIDEHKGDVDKKFPVTCKPHN